MSTSPPPPPAVYSELDAKLPIVMLPVRLETRYFDVDPATVELRVRIFPSQAHVTSARPGVDPEERDQTIAYWRTRKATGDNSPQTDAAWQRLAQAVGDARALYLRRILTPTTDAAGGLVFPAVTLNPPPGTADVLTGEAIGLPSRFFVSGYTGFSRRFLVNGLAVPATVVAGPHGDPAAIKWQSDFAAAESIGLAIRVKVARDVVQTLTRLMVFGVREGADAATSTAALDSLFERHAREDGIALLTAGTPTNNTPAARVTTPAPSLGVAPGRTTDAGRLATALGLDLAAFADASGTHAATETMVQAMHTALWPAGLGYFLEPLMMPLSTPASAARGKTLFQKFVRPRGPYPTLAFGGQPFGVLPVGALSWWEDAQGHREKVVTVVNGLRGAWRQATDFVPRLGKSADVGADLNKVLSQSPVSTRWLARTAQSNGVVSGRFYIAGLPFQPALDQFWKIVNQSKAWRAYYELTPLQLDPTPLLLDFIFSDETFQLNVALVAGAEASRTAKLTVNYIDAIANAEVAPLKTHDVAGSSPRTLLYLLLRHATLLVMGRTANRFQSAGVDEPIFIDDPASTVWSRLNIPIAALDNRTLADVFKGTLPTHPDLAEFAQHRAAMKTLSALPVGELERLTAEAVDASSHRLDAWATALASERLAAMRTAQPRGSHIGAYAWVEAPPIPSVLSRDGAPPIPDPDSEGYIHAPRLDHARTAAVLRAGFNARQQEGAESPLTIDLSSDRVRDAHGLAEPVRNGASLAALLGERIERWMVDLGIGPQLPMVRDQFSLVDGSGRKRIDGLKAAQVWGQAPPANLGAVPARLAAVMDAVGDLLFAEALHQQSNGNPARAQPALAALDTGITLPSEFEVVRTEPDSTSATWRVVLPLMGTAWDAWLTDMIGDAGTLSATVAKAGQAPAALTLTQIGVTAAGLLDFVNASAEASALANKFSDAAGGGTVTYSPALETALQAAFAISRMLRGSRPLQAGDAGTVRNPLPGFDLNSARKEWLHDLARVRPAIEGLDSLDFILRTAGRTVGLQFVSAAPGLNVVSIGNLPVESPQGLLIDAWNETTPATAATTGIAMHYDAPRSRAPQAILVMTPAKPGEWNITVVESALIETADMAMLRMVRPVDVHGSFLPGLYFADNLSADTVATDFVSVGKIAQFTTT